MWGGYQIRSTRGKTFFFQCSSMLSAYRVHYSTDIALVQLHNNIISQGQRGSRRTCSSRYVTRMWHCWTDYKVAVLVYRCLHATGTVYLAHELSHSSNFVNLCRLHFQSTHNLIVRRTKLEIVRLRLPVMVSETVVHLCFVLLTSASSVNIFKTRLNKFLFTRSFP